MKSLLACAALGLTLVAASPALAKDARCWTTDDGYYDCWFESTGSDGSFEISARGYPTFSLVVDSPGFAWGFANFDGNGVSLPGMFVRQRDDGACWANPETDVEICAW